MSRIRPAVAIAGCALGLLTGVAAQVRDQAKEPERGTGKIDGRVEVIAVEPRAPLRHATVVLARAGDRSTRATATDTEGRFTFDNLPPGVYRAEVWKAGFVTTSPATDIALGHESPLTVAIEVQRAGALEGRFFDDRGVPIERMKITAAVVVDTQGANAPASYTATTDDLGRFRIHTLPAGRYRVRGVPPVSASGVAIFYPGTTDRNDAAIVTVASGQTVDQLDVWVPSALLTPIPPEAAAAIEREIASLPETPEFSGRIAGRVTRSDLGMPIPNATVQLLTNTGLTLRTVTSDGDGGFVFMRLPEGRYVVKVRAPGFINLLETALSSGAQGLPITIAAGVRPAQADIGLTPAGAVEVRVVDEFGEPAPGVSLRVIPKTAGVGEPRPSGTERAPQTTGPTDDRGWFRAYRLPAGEYFVVSVPEPFARSAPSTFAATYFPGTLSREMASAVRVESGMDTYDVSFALLVARTVTLSGVAVSSDGRPVPALTTVLFPGGSMPFSQGGGVPAAGTLRTTTAADGSFVFSNIPEGPYTLSGSAPGWFGTMPVNVSAGADAEQPTVVLTVWAPSTARGRIHFDGAAAPPGPQNIGLQFLATTLAPGLVVSESLRVAVAAGRVIDKGRAFEIRGIMAPGLIRVYGSTPMVSASAPLPRPMHGSPWVLARVMLHGRDITDLPYDFHMGDVDGLDVVLTSRVGVVSGTAKDADGTVAPATVLIFGADSLSPHYVTRTTRTARTNEQGTFEFTGVLPGRYFAIARQSSTGLGIAQLLDLRSRATLVTVSEGANASVSLTVAK